MFFFKGVISVVVSELPRSRTAPPHHRTTAPPRDQDGVRRATPRHAAPAHNIPTAPYPTLIRKFTTTGLLAAGSEENPVKVKLLRQDRGW